MTKQTNDFREVKNVDQEVKEKKHWWRWFVGWSWKKIILWFLICAVLRLVIQFVIVWMEY